MHIKILHATKFCLLTLRNTKVTRGGHNAPPPPYRSVLKIVKTFKIFMFFLKNRTCEDLSLNFHRQRSDLKTHEKDLKCKFFCSTPTDKMRLFVKKKSVLHRIAEYVDLIVSTISITSLIEDCFNFAYHWIFKMNSSFLSFLYLHRTKFKME